MSFAPKPGCPMCGIVSSAVHSQISCPSSPSTSDSPANSNKPEILWRDDNFTIYRERVNPVSSKAHIIVALNLHVPSIYTLSSTDLPLLISIRDLARRILSQFSDLSSSNRSTSGLSPLHLPSTIHPPGYDYSRFRIGFITPPFRDSKIPVTDHLHAHAYITPADLMGWWRGVAYSPLAWYDIDDLIAEIRESSSNNRIRSAATKPRPIDQIPGAGARSGHANGQETTDRGLVSPDANLEDGLHSARFSMSPGSPTSPTTVTAHTPLGQSSFANLSSASLLPSSSRIPTESV